MAHLTLRERIRVDDVRLGRARAPLVRRLTNNANLAAVNDDATTDRTETRMFTHDTLLLALLQPANRTVPQSPNTGRAEALP